ncbi:MAG TPA: hypothetical protein VK864_14035, partial [Longimicrobiales bacterium]|nr:hypothetical protein [Longimicrobiales bacterium]
MSSARTATPYVALKYARRVLGAALGLLATYPFYRLLSEPDTGLAGRTTVEIANAYQQFSLLVLMVALMVALLVARVWSQLQFVIGRLGNALVRIPEQTFALTCALIALVLAALFGIRALQGEPNLIDAVAQLVHARYLASGQLAGPLTDVVFGMLPQMLVTPAGWVSQYPPGHVVLLAIGLKLGMVELIGPLLLGATAYLTARLAELLFPEQRAVGRLGALFVAGSPFLIAHAGAYLSHTSAAAFGVAALYLAVRANFHGRGLIWAGAALGGLFTIRPLTAVTMSAVILLWSSTRGRLRDRWAAPLWIAHSVLPFVVLIGLYNLRFFGSAWRFGYEAALGRNGALGFGIDPWGNVYGPLQALAYTSAELAALSLLLLETALPAVLAIAVFVVLAPRLERGDRLLLAWVLAPLATHTFYWHHGLFMGPRMLNEYAPAWCLLFARAIVSTPRLVNIRRKVLGYSPAALAGALLLVGSAAMLVLAPMRLASYATPPSPAAAAVTQLSSPALVFVHTAWEDRIAMRLAAVGMRLDSIETALRQNPTCAVQLYADARVRARPLPPLDLAPRAQNLPPRREIAPG